MFSILPGIERARYRWLYIVVNRTFTSGVLNRSRTLIIIIIIIIFFFSMLTMTINKKDNKKDKSQRKLVNLTFHDQLVLDWPQTATSWYLDDLAPLIDKIEAPSRAKLSLQRIQFTIQTLIGH